MSETTGEGRDLLTRLEEEALACDVEAGYEPTCDEERAHVAIMQRQAALLREARAALAQLEGAQKALHELWGEFCPDCGPDQYELIAKHISAALAALQQEREGNDEPWNSQWQSAMRQSSEAGFHSGNIAERVRLVLAALAAQQQALEDVDNALDGQFASKEPCIARAVQQQREALDKYRDQLREARAQIEQWKEAVVLSATKAREPLEAQLRTTEAKVRYLEVQHEENQRTWDEEAAARATTDEALARLEQEMREWAKHLDPAMWIPVGVTSNYKVQEWAEALRALRAGEMRQ